MSTTTLLEPSDTPMLDFSGDFDVHMNTAGTSSEAWMQAETEMDDPDVNTLRAASEAESVEVEMQAYEAENPEYEMADDQEEYYQDGEIADVEVIDAPPSPPPAGLSAIVDTLPAAAAFVDTLFTSPELPGSALDASGAVSQPDVVADAPDSVPTNVADGTSAPEFQEGLSVPVESKTATEDVSNAVAGDVAAETADAKDPEAPQLVVELTERTATDSAEESAPPHEEDSALAEQAQSSGEAAPVSSVVLNEGHDTADTEVPPPAYVEEAVETNGEALHDEPESYDHNAEQSVSDPHEISDGVFIEPPPAVFVSLGQADQPSLCLFNQPVPGSPSSSRSGVAQQVFDLMLHHRPTLYYEPLSTVFEALRQETRVGELPDFQEGELVIDAYDLQLVLSEDNVYAREVTLHDLNVLHDDSDLSGPLRVRIYFAVPRFIMRFHTLREQIARLQLTGGGEEEDHEPAQGEPDPALAHEEGDDGGPHASPTVDVANETEERPATQDEEASRGAPSQATGTEEGAKGEESSTERNIPGDDVITNTGQQLDADAVHAPEERAHDEEENQDAEPTEFEDVTQENLGESYEETYDETHEELQGSEDLEVSAGVDVEETPVVKDVIDETEAGEEFEPAEPFDEVSAGAADAPDDEYEDLGGEEHSEETDEAAAPTHDDESANPDLTTYADETETTGVAAHESHDAENAIDPPAELMSSNNVDESTPLIDNPEDVEWEDTFYDEDELGEEGAAEQDDSSNQSSVTLSSTSKTSKRVFDEIDGEDDNDNDNEVSPPMSPGSKRARVE